MRRRIPSILTLSLTLALPAAASRLEPAVLPGEGFAAVVERVLPTVVRVATVKTVTVPAQESGKASSRRRESGEGSGVIISADGYLITNYHVVEDASKIAVQLSDGRELEARVLAADPQTDVGVLKIDATGLPSATFGDSSRVRPGDYAIAIGNPFGVGTTVSLGIVSAVSRVGEGFERREEWIQTDAAINPGNSGGPLITVAGELVGINTAIVSPSGGSSGVGFAIPSNLVREVMSELIVHGHVRRGYMGIGMQPLTPALAEALRAPVSGGAVIADVAPGSPAEAAGLAKGDVVAAIDGQSLRDFGRVRLQAAMAKPGAVVRVQAYRDGEERNFTVTLAEKPEQTARNQEAAPAEPATGADRMRGIQAADIDGNLRKQFDLAATAAGVVLSAVDAESDGAASGLRAGDIVLAVNKQTVKSAAEFAAAVQNPGKAVLFEVSRGGSTWFFAVGSR